MFHTLADPEDGGVEARLACAYDLDQILLFPTDTKIAAFLLRWGEGLREILLDPDLYVAPVVVGNDDWSGETGEPEAA